MSELTPMMEQYYRLKKEYPGSILFFRMGDFYEMFEEDAKTVSKELDIVLTSRDKGKEDPIPMAGVPYHSVDSYLQRLIKKGYTVAIAEQVEDPSKAKGLVKREVVRVVTPGTVIDEGLLEDASNNFLMAIYKNNGFGIALADISTGDFLVTEVEKEEDLLSEVIRHEPKECIIPSTLFEEDDLVQTILNERQMMIHPHKIEAFRLPLAQDKVLEHFKTDTLESLGLVGKDLAIRAAGAALDYLEDTQKRDLDYISRIRLFSDDQNMLLDSTTIKNLEIFRNLREGGKKGTLLNILDQTVTPMGTRKLRSWLQQPLLETKTIERRLEAVEELTEGIFLRDDLRDDLKEIPDIERLASRVVYGNANARDLLAIKKALFKVRVLKKALKDITSGKLIDIQAHMDPINDLIELLDEAIVEDPPATVREGGMIKEGFDERLDELRSLTREGKNWINSIEKEEKSKTGIDRLKVGYNKVHGYYIEVPKTRTDKVPDRYHRKQTLKNSERYYTPELKEREEKIISAEEKMEALEYDLFHEICGKVSNEIERIQRTAGNLGALDVLTTLAEIAVRNDYTRPTISEDGRISIKEGRHPVVENTVGSFVPNDAYLDMNKNNFLIVTGPNMSGKSTFMRQVALITLMAQVGSFVPAEKAQIGVVDRIFTRVGAFDALTKGQSTFMVEMVELANILHNASKESLILLDEIGSGTSTFDGLSIAWAVTEFIAGRIEAKTLFATHYHELTELEQSLQGVKNLHVATKEQGDKVTFLRKVREGHTDESYGIHVASLAGVPDPVVARANEVLRQIEEENTIHLKDHQGPRFTQVVFDVEGEKESHPIVEEIKNMDLDNITPLDALNELWRLKKKTEDA